ncbi:MAG: lipopolysaccharide biosynthesis protein [Collinsella sp.]
MSSIVTRKTDVIWNYIGTIVSMASGFILLPLLIRFLSDEELGLWYVYIALSNFAMLFEFGFNPTFARNIVYVVSGARRLSVKGCDKESVEDGIDWHLLNTVIKASKVIYAILAVAVLLLLSTAGSAYIFFVASNMNPADIWLSWALFCVSIFLNLYFLWSITVLRGYGDIAGEKKAVVIGRVGQLFISGVLLVAGFGLVGASIGFLMNAVLLRVSALIMLRKHREIEDGRRSDKLSVNFSSIQDIFSTIFHVAWRDGLVQLSLYASTQAMSILSSIFLGLSETGTYSILLQFANAIYNFASTYPKSFYPAMQSAYAEGESGKQRKFVSTGIVGYWMLFMLGTAGVCVVIFPLLPLFKPGIDIDYALFLVMCLYVGLLQQHSIFCNYIISMNEIPYMWGYIIASIIGCALVCLFSGLFGMGAWGIILGQGISQLAYNNWKWPVYLCKKLGSSYHEIIKEGVQLWITKFVSRFSRSRA